MLLYKENQKKLRLLDAGIPSKVKRIEGIYIKNMEINVDEEIDNEIPN